MQEVHRLIEQAAATPAPVLIHGRDRHRQGAGRPRRPRALARARRALRRRQLRGACPRPCSRASSSATSAAPSPARPRPRRGCFERADGGTLFLDEIGEHAARRLQAKLLRVLEDGEFAPRRRQRAAITVDVRVVAATNRDLERGGRRRRASARTSTTGSTSSRSRVPPLRERAEDIPLLVDRFVEEFTAQARQARRRASTTAAARAPHAPRVAGQRPRAAQRGGARVHRLRGRRDRPPAPARHLAAGWPPGTSTPTRSPSRSACPCARSRSSSCYAPWPRRTTTRRAAAVRLEISTKTLHNMLRRWGILHPQVLRG